MASAAEMSYKVIHDATRGGLTVNEEFKIGDVVELRSGGPEMTVIGEQAPNLIMCTWFDKNDESRSQAFPKEALEMAE
jgi:uncharacterized protein YodC (DUF2158 family)